MANSNSIKVVAIKQKGSRSLTLSLLLGSENGTYDVSIVDQNGIFGLELPEKLGLKLRDFGPIEARRLVSAVRSELAKNLVPA